MSLLLAARRERQAKQGWQQPWMRIGACSLCRSAPSQCRSVRRGRPDGGRKQQRLAVGAHRLQEICAQSMENMALAWHYTFGKSAAHRQRNQSLNPLPKHASVEDGSTVMRGNTASDWCRSADPAAPSCMRQNRRLALKLTGVIDFPSPGRGKQTFNSLTDGGTVASSISTLQKMFSIEDVCF